MRTGIGYDSHRFEEGRNLVLGGVTVPYERGLKGHSDADVLIHAIIDAILGAAKLGNIGKAFPDNDAKYKDISSILLLERACNMLKEKGYKISNIDSVLVLQEPKISPYVPEMERNIAKALNIDVEQVSVKGKTEEGMGFVGRKEGIKAFAAVLIE